MREGEKIIASSFLFILIVLWLSFVFHRDLRFAGSFSGVMVGIAGAILLTTSFLYLLTKRLSRLRGFLNRYLSNRTLLTIHIVSGLLGPILAIIHTGHKFHSPLGITLVVLMFLVVLSGFVGRYFQSFISADLREKRDTLLRLEQLYRATAEKLRTSPEERRFVSALSGFFRRPILTLLLTSREERNNGRILPVDALRISDAIADVEYAIKSHEVFLRRFSWWLRAHLFFSILFVLLLVAHIFSSLYFGFRWLE